MKNLLLIISATYLLFSCTPKPIDIDLEALQPKLVIGSQVVPNQVMIITVSKSFSALDNSSDEALLNSLLVANANVWVTYSGHTDVLFSDPNSPGVYASISTPLTTDTEYTLNVYDPQTGESITSTSTMLAPISFISVIADSGINGTISYIDVTVNIADLASENNYYMVNLYSSDALQNPEESSIFDFQSTIPATTFLIADLEYGNGNAITKTHRLYDWNTDTIFASLSNISREYYDFLVAKERSGNTEDQLLSEPTNFPSNVQGGYGYFNTHYPTGITVKVN
jgi:hypothetical protein